MLSYGGTLMPMVAWMPSASPAVSCGGQTSYSITSTACLGPSSLTLFLRVALGSGYALITPSPTYPGCYAILESFLQTLPNFQELTFPP